MEVPSVADITNETKSFHFNLCIVCQTDTGAQLVVKPLQTSVKKARDSMLEISQHDLTYERVANLLTSISVETLLDEKTSYHRDCYQEVTNSRILKKKRTSEIPKAATNSFSSSYVQQSKMQNLPDRKKAKLIELQTNARDAQLKKAIYENWKDQEMMIRYESAFDGPANN